MPAVPANTKLMVLVCPFTVGRPAAHRQRPGTTVFNVQL